MSNNYILSLSCPDTTGIVASVSQFIAGHNGWIIEASQYGDPVSNWFFMRVVIRADSLAFSAEEFQEKFSEVASRFDMQLQIHDTQHKKRAVILVSRHDHCLMDLLYRYRSQEFDFDIPCVISNHQDCADVVAWHDIPFHHVPMEKSNRAEAFEKIRNLYLDCEGDVMVLARFMQILPPSLCDEFAGSIINIHHSFLPSFVGAKPFEKAFKQGVKLVGATSHYVTSELDAGAIIEQDVVRISHDHSIEDIARLSKDVEKNVLARALRYHVQDRVLIHENKTIVFDH